MSSGDVRVMGLVMGTHLLEDIKIDVPHGTTVTIPADLASRSRDLHRAIGSKCVFVLPANMGVIPNGQQSSSTVDAERIRTLEARNRELEQECLRLREELKSVNSSRDEKLDAILLAIQTRPVVTVSGQANGQANHTEVADGSAPTYIPSEIKTGVNEARIESKTDETGSSSVTDAASRLRQLRNRQ